MRSAGLVLMSASPIERESMSQEELEKEFETELLENLEIGEDCGKCGEVIDNCVCE